MSVTPSEFEKYLILFNVKTGSDPTSGVSSIASTGSLSLSANTGDVVANINFNNVNTWTAQQNFAAATATSFQATNAGVNAAPRADAVLAVGLNATKPYGLFVSGTQTTTDGSAVYGHWLSTQININSAADAFGFVCYNTLAPNAGQTIGRTSAVHGSINFSNNGAVTDARAIFGEIGVSIGCAVPRARTGYFKQPLAGTYRAALGVEGGALIGSTFATGNFNAPTDGLAILGNLSVGSSTAAAPSLFNVGTSAQLQINSSGVITNGVWNATKLSEVYGGTNQSAYTLGDTLYSSATNVLSKLAGNTTSAKQYLSQTGNGTVSAAPVWATIAGSDITGAALTSSNDTNVTLSLSGLPTTALLRATSLTMGWTGVLSNARGGTNTSTVFTAGSIVYMGASAYSQDNANLFFDAGNKRLGVGTASPNEVLTLSAAISSMNLISSVANTGNLKLATTGSNCYIQAGLSTTTDSKANLIFASMNGGTEWMRLTNAGVLAIGTNAANGGLLTLNGALAITNSLSLAASAGQYTYLASGFASPNSGRLYIGDGSGWSFRLSKRISSVDTDLFYFLDSGRFGLNDPTPAVTLSCVGAAVFGYAAGQAVGANSVAIAGSLFIGATYPGSLNAGAVSSSPNSTSTFNTTFGSLTFGTAKQNNCGSNIILNCRVLVSSATSAVVRYGTGTTTTPPMVNATETFSGAKEIPLAIPVAVNQYVLIDGTGTISVSSVVTVASGY